MAQIEFKNVEYSYPESKRCALNDINLSINAGEVVLLCGKTGSGKSTLLRLLKKGLYESGSLRGKVYYENIEISKLSDHRAVCEIGYVFQDSDSQIVMDTVWHELAFSLENLALSRDAMRARIAEMATFFGLESIMSRPVSMLSGGEKKILCLASVLVLRPRVLLLDEPLAALDPISAQKLVEMLTRIRRELGVTIIIAEHRMEELLSLVTQIVYLKDGSIAKNAGADPVCRAMWEDAPELLPQMPLLYFKTKSEGEVFKTPYDAQKALENHSFVVREKKRSIPNEDIFAIKEVDFFYPAQSKATLSNITLSVKRGECLAILGGNGAGKSTLLKLMAHVYEPTHGKITLYNKKLKSYSNLQLYNTIGYLAQNPRLYFTKGTVGEELDCACESFGLSEFLQHSPSELSGGQQQLLALAMVLQNEPEILLLDEPTSSLDGQAKRLLADKLTALCRKGKSVIFVTHDMEFAAQISTRCIMLFDGEITACAEAETFFNEHYFYTTPLRRVLRNEAPTALRVEDLRCEE